MFSKFSEEAQKSLLLAREEMIKLRHPYIGSEHLLLAILSNKNLPITKMLSKYNINYENFYNEIKKIYGERIIGKFLVFIYSAIKKNYRKCNI